MIFLTCTCIDVKVDKVVKVNQDTHIKSPEVVHVDTLNLQSNPVQIVNKNLDLRA